MTPPSRVVVSFFALLLGAFFATSAEAAAKRVGVPKFDGVQEALVRNLDGLRRYKPDKLVRRRREKYLKMGQYSE